MAAHHVMFPHDGGGMGGMLPPVHGPPFPGAGGGPFPGGSPGMSLTGFHNPMVSGPYNMNEQLT